MLWKVRKGRHQPQWGQTREDVLEEGASKNGKGFIGGDGRESRERGGKGRHRGVRRTSACPFASAGACTSVSGRKETLLPSSSSALPLPLPSTFPLLTAQSTCCRDYSKYRLRQIYPL